MERKFKNRLLKLADFLDKLPKKLFNIETITNCDGAAREALPYALEHPRRNCGTAACAMGWSPACFPRQIEWTERDGIGMKDGSSRYWWGTAKKFFGLTDEEINYLFTGDFYEYQVSPKKVAKTIRKFVADGLHKERDESWHWQEVWCNNNRDVVKEAK